MSSVPFRVLPGGSALLNDDLPKDTQKKNDHIETNDLEWVMRAEKLGAIERLNKRPAQGIQKITIVEGALESDPVSYIIEIEDEDTFSQITLAEADIFSYAKFRQKYLATFQKMLPHLSNIEWEAVIAPIIEEADRIKEDTNEAVIVLEVINKIENSEVVSDKKDLVAGNGYKIWYDAATDTIGMLSRELEPISEKYKITLQRLSELLKDYMRGRTKQERIGNKRFQLWRFIPSKFSLKKNEQ